MATTTVPSLSFPAQPLIVNRPDTREVTQESHALTHGHSLHLAIIQRPVRKWQRPWRHQRAIVLFAKSPLEMKERIQRERRIRAGEQVLRVISVGQR